MNNIKVLLPNVACSTPKMHRYLCGANLYYITLIIAFIWEIKTPNGTFLIN